MRHPELRSGSCVTQLSTVQSLVLPCDLYDDEIISTSGCHRISPNSTGITLRCKILQQRIPPQKKGSCAPTYNPWHKMSSPKPVTLVLVFFLRWFEFHIRSGGKKKIHLLSSQEYCRCTALAPSLSLSLPLLGWYWRNKVFFHHSQAWLPQSSFFFFFWNQRSLSVFRFACRGTWVCVCVKVFSAARVNCRWKEKSCDINYLLFILTDTALLLCL